VTPRHNSASSPVRGLTRAIRAPSIAW
jgi:hypothetical protein